MRAILAGEEIPGTKMRLAAKAHGGVGHGGPMIAAGRSRNTGGGYFAHQEIGKGAARLERARMLHELELEEGREAFESQVPGAYLEHGRSAHVRADARVGRSDGLSRDPLRLSVGHCPSPRYLLQSSAGTSLSSHTPIRMPRR
jgi:hypothetical protein